MASTRARTATAVRFEPDIHDQLIQAAEDHGRSLNWLVNEACRWFLPRLLPADQIRIMREDPTDG